MIKSDAQRDRTVAQIQGFRQAMAKVKAEMSGKRAAAVTQSYASMIRQLEDELHEYDDLKRGELTLPNVDRLDQIAPSSPEFESPKEFRRRISRGGWV